jgi:Cu/Ag efflux protein CusF
MLSWHIESVPNVQNKNRAAGTVVIDFTVNTSGQVTEAHANAKHTTITDTALVKKCEAAVKNIKLTSTGPVTAIQKGQLHFKFEVL